MRRFAAIAAAFAGVFAAFGAQLPSPLSPSAERDTFHLADSNLVVELVASEPNLRAPVAVAWDSAGRMFVAEMTDYPSGPVSGRIRLLEDRDGDGVYEKATIFASNLAFPNGVMPWRNGVLVTAAPDIWFLADTNGDGVADVRERVLTGFTEGNQQLRVNGLYWGIDNWIYGANGRSDGEVRWADDTTAGSIRRRDFRFRPDTKQFQAIAGNSQFGMGHDDWGGRFPVFNNNPIRHVVIEDRYVERQPLLAGTDVVPGISPPTDGKRVYALTPPALLIPQPVGFFTSACGPSIYRGTALPAGYYGNAFVCEPVQNVIQRRILVPNGGTFIAAYAHTNAEFLSAMDPWFHGVFTAAGPDGAFYIVDMYREWVEHPHWVAPEIRDKVDWRRGEQHGRIWRVRGRDAKTVAPVKVASASNAALAEALTSSNGWTRDTAHRLLVERQARDARPALETLAVSGPTSQSRVHALHILDALGACDDGLVRKALHDSDPHVRAEAVLLSEGRRDLQGDLLAMTDERDGRTRLQLACALDGVADAAAKRRALAAIASTGGDEWLGVALLSSAGDRPWLVVEETLNNCAQANRSISEPLLVSFATAVAASGNVADARAFFGRLAAWDRNAAAELPLLGVAAFLDNPRSTDLLKKLDRNDASHFTEVAADVVKSGRAEERGRIAAIRVLSKLAAFSNRKVNVSDLLSALLNRGEPEPIQRTAARSLLEKNDPAVAQTLFARWPSLPKAAHQELLASAARNTNSAKALLAAVDRGTLPLIEVDAVTRQGIEKLKSQEIKAAAQKLFAEAVSSDREAIVQKYQPALRLDADRKRGAVIFEKNCTVCHQMQGTGAKIGPDLSGIGTQTRESLLVQILDPSRQVLPDFVAYTAETKDGDTYTGFIAAENASTITLRRPNEPDVTLRRADLTELKTNGKSLMPDGLEAAMTTQDMADLIEFLRRPDRTLFTEARTQ